MTGTRFRNDTEEAMTEDINVNGITAGAGSSDSGSVTGSAEEQKTEKTEKTQSAEDIYVYDVPDDEPVADKDFYRDYTGELNSVKTTVPEANVVSAAAPKPTGKSGESAFAEENRTAYETQGAERGSLSYNSQTSPESAPNVKINRIYTINTVISMVTLCAVAACFFTGYAYLKRLEQDLGLSKKRISELEDGQSPVTAETEEYIDAVSLLDEETISESAIEIPEAEVEIEKGKLLLYDSYVGYSWVPVISGVKPNTYKKENFHVDDNYRMEYVSDGDVSSYFGIDVSSYQGDIDWDAVRSDGVEFAILRIGLRGYGAEGNIKLDDKFFQNYENAHKAGIDLGVYFYSQAISVEEAEEEAKFVLEQLGGRALEYPVVFDWEPVDTVSGDDPPRTEDVMPGTLTLSAIAFCDTIRDAGYEAMIYTNKKMAYIKYDLRRLTDYPVWLALYSTELTYYYDFDMWQYGFGQINGIEGDVDLDIAMIR